MHPKEQVVKKYQLMLRMSDWISLDVLVESALVSRAQVFRYMRQIQDEFGVTIIKDSFPGEISVHYKISDFGVINRERLILMMNSIEQQH